MSEESTEKPEHVEECRSCGYRGTIDNWRAAMSVYHDICCPECGSTNCEHNSKYTSELMANMRKLDEEAKSGTVTN
jgi:hypothetical protein